MNSLPDIKIFMMLKNDFEESSLPFMVDPVVLHSLTNRDFIDHIKRVGQVFYQG